MPAGWPVPTYPSSSFKCSATCRLTNWSDSRFPVRAGCAIGRTTGFCGVTHHDTLTAAALTMRDG